MIQPSGISLKPNENQMKDFSKRAKNLDRELIFKIIFEKMSNYENASDSVSTKILTVNYNLYLENSLCSGKSNSIWI